MTRTTTAADDAIYQAVVSYWCNAEDGTPTLIRAGSRHRLSSGFPRRHPQHFVPDASSEAEVDRARRALEADYEPEPTSPDTGIRFVGVLR